MTLHCASLSGGFTECNPQTQEKDKCPLNVAKYIRATLMLELVSQLVLVPQPRVKCVELQQPASCGLRVSSEMRRDVSSPAFSLVESTSTQLVEFRARRKEET